MTTELFYLALTALLTGTLWIPYVVGQVMTNGMLTPANYKDPAAREVPHWAGRCNRAHINAVENFAPFAALVLVIHVTGASTATTVFWTVAFFWLRLAHAVFIILGIPYLRTLVFTIGWIAVVVLFFAALNGPVAPAPAG